MKSCLVLLATILITLGLTSFKKSEYNWCEKLVVEDLELGIDGIAAEVFKDSNSVIFVKIKNISKTKSDGPDYCLLTITNQDMDTIAGVSINGIPGPGKTQVYPAICRNKKLKEIPAQNTLTVNLQYYCSKMKILKD